MVFSSLLFLCIFFPAVLLIYNFSKNIAYRNIVLVIASLIFYAWGEPVWVILLLISTVTDYIHGLLIDKYRGTIGAKLALLSSVVINLGILMTFKYADFFIENINFLLGTSIKTPGFSLPLGISFYTFQTLSYTIDMYRGNVKVQKSILSFMCYVTMFPQLVAGPIVRYSDIAKQLRKRTVTAAKFSQGAKRFSAGLCKKVILANSVGEVASMLLSTAMPTTLSAWLGILMYSFQIYFDFSGYSDMAIGIGHILGFDFSENFRYPYIARSITHFWRRWHISLSSFFRDYVYIPLGGNRKRAVLNLFIVWFLTGFWHGASWNFILWGVYYGVLLFVEKYILRFLNRQLWVIGNIYTLFAVVIGWGLFYFTDFGELVEFFCHAFGQGCALYDLTTVSVLYENIWLIALCIVACTPIPKKIYDFVCCFKPLAVIIEPVLMIAGFAASFALLVGETYNPFLYFRF